MSYGSLSHSPPDTGEDGSPPLLAPRPRGLSGDAGGGPALTALVFPARASPQVASTTTSYGARYQTVETREYDVVVREAGGPEAEAEAEPEATYVTLPGSAEEGGGRKLLVKSPGLLERDTGGDDAEPPVYRSIFLVVLAQFMGYAVLVSFQHKLKVALGISDDDEGASHRFGVAVSTLYIGNLVFRLAHNFLPISPRGRVYFAMGSMSLSMSLLLVVYSVPAAASIRMVYAAYSLGGAGIGAFESNLLSECAPLGHGTKLWAISGMPVGFGVILLLGFFLTAVGTPPVAVYAGVLASLVAGAATFAVVIPPAPEHAHTGNVRAFASNAALAREWLPSIWLHSLALMVDMFMVALWSGLFLYLLNGKEVPLFGPDSSVTVPHDWFFVVYNCGSMLGDNAGRKLAYRWRRPGARQINPLLFLGLTLVGAAILLSLYAVLAPIGIFLVFATNGLVYGTSSKHIDLVVSRRFQLIALSVWLMVGDAGSVAGSNLIPHVRDWVCAYHRNQHYVCTSN